MIERRIHPETLAGDPFAAAGERLGEATQIRRARRTHAEEVEAVFEEETRLGRPMTPGEREHFVRGFHSQSYVAEVRLLARVGLLDEDEDP